MWLQLREDLCFLGLLFRLFVLIGRILAGMIVLDVAKVGRLGHGHEEGFMFGSRGVYLLDRLLLGQDWRTLRWLPYYFYCRQSYTLFLLKHLGNVGKLGVLKRP